MVQKKKIDYEIQCVPEDHETWNEQTRLEILAKLIMKLAQRQIERKNLSQGEVNVGN